MKRTIVAVLAVMVLAACGDDEKVLWDCTCTVTCDGDSDTVHDNTGCGTQDEAQSEIDRSVAACDADLAQCTAHSCECTCDPTDTTCE